MGLQIKKSMKHIKYKQVTVYGNFEEKLFNARTE